MRFSALLTWLPEDGDVRCGSQTHDTDYLYARVSTRVYHDEDGQQFDEPGMLVTDDAMYQQLVKERAAHPMLAGRARTRFGSLGGSNWRVPIWPPPEQPESSSPSDVVVMVPGLIGRLEAASECPD